MEIRGSNPDIKIYSTVALENISGVVYIEARNVLSVQKIIQGFINIKTTLVKLVPLSQFDQVFDSQSEYNTELAEGAFVRFKHGVYQGDLA